MNDLTITNELPIGTTAQSGGHDVTVTGNRQGAWGNIVDFVYATDGTTGSEYTHNLTGIVVATDMSKAGTAANQAVNAHIFNLYLENKSDNTIRTQLNGLNAFSAFLATVGVNVSGNDLQSLPMAWDGMTFGLVEAFKKWQLKQGVSIATINNRLSAIKMYVKLAGQVGTISLDETMKIRSVTGYSRKVGKKIDEKRIDENTAVRTGNKKADSVLLDSEQAKQMKTGYDMETAQGARDALLMCLLIDHGLRRSEVTLLTVDNFDMKRNELSFYRPKVDKQTTHKLTAATMSALQAYAPYMPAIGSMVLGSKKGGKLTSKGMSERAVTKRVKYLASKMGVDSLSAHDCRHYAATDMARKNYSLRELMDWFGWSSPAMAMRYVESAKVHERDKG